MSSRGVLEMSGGLRVGRDEREEGLRIHAEF